MLADNPSVAKRTLLLRSISHSTPKSPLQLFPHFSTARSNRTNKVIDKCCIALLSFLVFVPPNSPSSAPSPRFPPRRSSLSSLFRPSASPALPARPSRKFRTSSISAPNSRIIRTYKTYSRNSFIIRTYAPPSDLRILKDLPFYHSSCNPFRICTYKPPRICRKQTTYNPFRIRTYKNSSRNSFRIRTYENHRGSISLGTPTPARPSDPRSFPPLAASPASSRLIPRYTSPLGSFPSLPFNQESAWLAQRLGSSKDTRYPDALHLEARAKWRRR